MQRGLQNRRVSVISGARQAGKTTLVRQAAGKGGVFRTLDDKTTMMLAQQDPREFVKNRDETLVIDEIQKVPDLMPEIKLAVDKDNRNGQYLLTGSANIRTLPAISDSLAGRITHIRLRPLTQGEIMGCRPQFLEMAFEGSFPMQIKNYDKEAIFDLAFRGGYPEAVRLTGTAERKQWFSDYIESLLERDLRDIENIRRQDALQDLVKILASWSSKYMDNAKIGAKMSLTKQTLETYINALERMFIFEKVPPWIKTDYEYIGRKPKLYATDTGLMAAILGWKQADVLNSFETADTDRAGKLMETFVFQELAAQVDVGHYDYSLRQYRDYKHREIDFLIERTDGAILGVEVKASSSVSKDDFASQIWFKNTIIKGKMPYKGLVLYSGEDTLSFGNGMWAIPIAALWGE
ncbi:MAG: ATP-binding protein [Treponema sp.]|nr:ATP-binding protein [Treponema sp.]